MTHRLGWFDAAIAHPLHRLVELYRIAQERRSLREADATRLADLGLSPKDVRCELARPFWHGRSA